MMKRILIVFLLSIPFFLFAQELQKADALVYPRIAEREISVGGDDADLPGFNNQSIQHAIDAYQHRFD
jgi:hypothetical protein